MKPLPDLDQFVSAHQRLEEIVATKNTAVSGLPEESRRVITVMADRMCSGDLIVVRRTPTGFDFGAFPAS